MPKIRLSAMIFGNVNATKDYKSITKLYTNYGRAISKTRIREADRLKEELKALLPDAIAGNERLLRLYAPAADEVRGETYVYSEEVVKSFIDELRKRQKEMNSITKELGIEAEKSGNSRISDE